MAVLFWWFGLQLYFGDERIPDELHMKHEIEEEPVMSPRVKPSKSFFCLPSFLCARSLIYLKLPLGVKCKVCSERREDHGVRVHNGSRNTERHPVIRLGEDRLAAPLREHPGEHFQLEIDADGSLGNPALWAVFHSMSQAPEVSLNRYECLYILSLGKKRLGHMKMNSGVEISLEKKKKNPGSFLFLLLIP